MYPCEWHKVWITSKLFRGLWWLDKMEWLASSRQKDIWFGIIFKPIPLIASISSCIGWMLDIEINKEFAIVKTGCIKWHGILQGNLDKKPFMMSWVWHVDRQKEKLVNALDDLNSECLDSWWYWRLISQWRWNCHCWHMFNWIWHIGIQGLVQNQFFSGFIWENFVINFREG